jgi:hypothetical protein
VTEQPAGALDETEIFISEYGCSHRGHIGGKGVALNRRGGVTFPQPIPVIPAFAGMTKENDRSDEQPSTVAFMTYSTLGPYARSPCR